MNKRVSFFITVSCCLFYFFSFGQSFHRIVSDKETGLPLAYASIGVKGKSIGGIADASGRFNTNISEALSTDSIIISYTGYEDVKLLIQELVLNASNEIKLQPKVKELKELVMVIKKDPVFLGNTVHSSRFTGWGDYKSSRGRVRGLRIEPDNYPLKISEFAVRFKDNEFDSVKLRLHIQSATSDSQLLTETIFFTVTKDQKWAYVDLEGYDIVVAAPVMVAVEWVDA